jgi:hypothetical protein
MGAQGAPASGSPVAVRFLDPLALMASSSRSASPSMVYIKATNKAKFEALVKDEV